MGLTDNRVLNYGLRALQLLLAIIVIGTDAYAIHGFHSRTVYQETPYGNYYVTYGVPAAWGFLIFCAVWTLIVVIAAVVKPASSSGRIYSFIFFGAELIAVLSWLAGFIATAVTVSNNTCVNGQTHCGSVKAATAFGAFEFLLFCVTALLAFFTIFSSRSNKPSNV